MWFAVRHVTRAAVRVVHKHPAEASWVILFTILVSATVSTFEAGKVVCETRREKRTGG